MDIKVEEFIGLDKKSAQNKADKLSLIFFLIRIDNKNYFSYPKKEDKRDDRLCVEIDKRKVTSATIM